MRYKLGCVYLLKTGSFVFAIAAMIVAALIEMYRVNQSSGTVYYIDSTANQRNDISPCK